MASPIDAIKGFFFSGEDPFIIEGLDDYPVSLPDWMNIENYTARQEGSDLYLTGKGSLNVVVRHYYDSNSPPPLVSQDKKEYVVDDGFIVPYIDEFDTLGDTGNETIAQQTLADTGSLDQDNIVTVTATNRFERDARQGDDNSNLAGVAEGVDSVSADAGATPPEQTFTQGTSSTSVNLNDAVVSEKKPPKNPPGKPRKIPPKLTLSGLPTARSLPLMMQSSPYWTN